MNEIPELDRITDKVLAYRPATQNQQKGERMADTHDVEIDGQTFSAIEVDFEIAEEDWNRYNLLDGGTIRTRQSVYRISKVLNEDGTDLIGEDGRQIYHVEWLPTAIKVSR